MVLAVFTENSFEPLRQAMPWDLTLKMLFLIATDSAHRASEIHTLCIDWPFLIQNRILCICLQTLHSCKTSTEVAFSSNIELSSFNPETSVPLHGGLA